MRTVFLCIVVAGACSLRAQSVLREQTQFPLQISPLLNLYTQSDVQQRLNTPFAEGVVHPSDTKSCAKLANKKREAVLEGAGGSDAQAQVSTLAECVILQTLSRARPSRTSYVGELNWDANVMSLLPPELAIAVTEDAVRAVQSADSSHQSWAEMDQSVKATSDGTDQILVTGNTFQERLIVWGRGDFTGDGVQDLLVQTMDAQGAYKNTRLFVLTRKNAESKLSVAKQLL